VDVRPAYFRFFNINPSRPNTAPINTVMMPHVVDIALSLDVDSGFGSSIFGTGEVVTIGVCTCFCVRNFALGTVTVSD
jgi:hypothetical protein